jgi:predicted ATPase
MIQRLRAQNFKSWKDTGDLRLAPLTGLFGTNSSGKTSILQLLLMLKQTVESADRQRVLNTGGDDRSPVDLGTFYDLIHGHLADATLEISVAWDLPSSLFVSDPATPSVAREEVTRLSFRTAVRTESGRPVVEHFSYRLNEREFGMQRQPAANKDEYALVHEGYPAKRYPGRAWPLPSPVKCYGFPDETTAYYQNVGFLPKVVLSLEQTLRGIAYLGPLREYPQRSYVWTGETPSDVGRRGELSIPALLAARARNLKVSFGRKGKRREAVEERIAYWLREMGMVDSYVLRQVAANRRDYEVRVRRTKSSPEVFITDVGFGVSQILPVLVLCYYVPEGSTIILEQPEIHLHPFVQAALADVLIEAVNLRHLQIIVESHSEHLLRRLQRRIAEETISADKTALYFCRMEDSSSSIEALQVDLFGYISNWPEDFFGDGMGELVAQTQAAMRRQGVAAEVVAQQ